MVTPALNDFDIHTGRIMFVQIKSFSELFSISIGTSIDIGKIRLAVVFENILSFNQIKETCLGGSSQKSSFSDFPQGCLTKNLRTVKCQLRYRNDYCQRL